MTVLWTSSISGSPASSTPTSSKIGMRRCPNVSNCSRESQTSLTRKVPSGPTKAAWYSSPSGGKPPDDSRRRRLSSYFSGVMEGAAVKRTRMLIVDPPCSGVGSDLIPICVCYARSPCKGETRRFFGADATHFFRFNGAMKSGKPTVRQVYALAAALCERAGEEFPETRDEASELIERLRIENGHSQPRLEDVPFRPRGRRRGPASAERRASKAAAELVREMR